MGRWNATSDLVVGGAGDWFGNAALLGRGFFIQRENMDSSVEMLTARALPACQFGGTVTGGTLSAPTQTPVGGQMNVRLRGRDNASNWVVGAVLSMQATEAWSTTARGSLVAIDTVLTGGSTLATRFSITGPGSIALGTQAAIATTATDGFVYIPTCAGTPTGVPTAITGLAPMVVNTTNNKLYFYSGGAWRDAGP